MAPSIPLPWSSWKRERSANESDDRELFEGRYDHVRSWSYSGQSFAILGILRTTTIQINTTWRSEVILIKCNFLSKKFSKYIVLANVSLHRDLPLCSPHFDHADEMVDLNFRPIVSRRTSRNRVESLPGSFERFGMISQENISSIFRNCKIFICQSESWRSSIVSLAAKIRRPDRDCCANDDARRRGITALTGRNSRRTISVSVHWVSTLPSPVAACSL